MNVQGLSEAEAAELRERHGPTQVAGRRPPSVARLLLRQVRDPLILVLFAAAALTVATGDYADAAIIAVITSPQRKSVSGRASTHPVHTTTGGTASPARSPTGRSRHVDHGRGSRHGAAVAGDA